MNPIEFIAFIFILISLVKIISISISPQSWNRNIVKKVFKNYHITAFVSFVLALVVLYYLLKSLTITEILASASFIFLLIVFGISAYHEDILKLLDKIYKDKTIIKKSIIYIIIWLILLLWGLKEIVTII